MRDSILNLDEPRAIDRRTLLTRVGMGGAGLMMGGLLAGCGGNSHHSSRSSGGDASYTDPSDVAVLNFALNLEYLEASYYTTGVGEFQLTADEVTGSGTAGTVAGGASVASSLGAYLPYFREIASDESNHVRALRAAIVARGGTPVARPNIDLNAVNVAIRTATGNANFNAFGDAQSFLLGAFLLSDVGVTAYVGGSQFLDASAAKLTAAQLLAVEAYHVGSIRSLIYQAGGTAVTYSQNISDARDGLDGSTDDDQGVGAGSDPTDGGFPNIALTFPTGSTAPATLPTAGLPAAGLAFPRTVSQVLAIVYNSSTAGTAAGGLFPSGVNGNLKAIQSLP